MIIEPPDKSEDSEKAGLTLSIQKTKIMASGPITSWQIDGETVETVADFIFLGSKITADGDCSHRWRSSIQSAKTRPGADCGSDHELLITKLRLKLKKVGKTTRPFRYDLNQTP